MTVLEQILDTHGVSIFRLIKYLNVNMENNQTRWYQKIRGEVGLTPQECRDIQNALYVLTKQETLPTLFLIDRYRAKRI